MKNDKSKTHLLKLTTTSELLKKELNIQREANKKFQKFKKSASQPLYFLNKSRLKKISDIYRTISLQKLSKNTSLNKSKSLHTSITPQKKPSGYSNHLFAKKQTCLNTLNLNKIFDTNEKTKRLRLDRTAQNQTNSNAFEIINQNATKFLMTQVQKLEEITNLTMQKAFLGQYDHFFKGLKEECFKKGHNAQIKVMVSKFCYLMELCQQKMIKLHERQIKSKYEKIQIDFSNTHTELKKKTLKMELLIKEIDQLKAHNIKVSNELSELREQKKNSLMSVKSLGEKRRKMQITHMMEIKVQELQTEISTPIYRQNFQNKQSQSEESSSRERHYFKQNEFLPQSKQLAQKQADPMVINEKIEMIKRIRGLERKQKELVRTLLVLKNDGIDVEKAFNEVISGQAEDIEFQEEDLQAARTRIPSKIKHMQVNDSYEADNSIIDSIDGLTVRYFDGEPEEEYAVYPIKHEYKSKPLEEAMQNKLKLNFDVLYEDYGSFEQAESPDHIEQSQPPTI